MSAETLFFWLFTAAALFGGLTFLIIKQEWPKIHAWLSPPQSNEWRIRATLGGFVVIAGLYFTKDYWWSTHPDKDIVMRAFSRDDDSNQDRSKLWIDGNWAGVHLPLANTGGGSRDGDAEVANSHGQKEVDGADGHSSKDKNHAAEAKDCLSSDTASFDGYERTKSEHNHE